MEALGIASSIAGLISLADVVVFKISRYYSLVKSAQSDIKDLLVEVQSLYGVLNSLKLLATCIEDNEQFPAAKNVPQLGHFQTCRQNLDELKKSLSKLDLDSLKGVAAAKAKLLWPFRAAETKELVAKISRNKRDLSDALTADGLTALINALSSQARLAEAVENAQIKIQKVIDEKAENEEDEQRKIIFDWCSQTNPYQKHRNAKSLRHPNTVLWFFDSPEYRKWVEEDNAAIWLFGIPGAGKTILTSAVIEEAKILADKNPQNAIAYYYCEYKLPETQNLINILGSLVRQISASSEDAFELLEEFYEEHNLKGKHPVLPTEEEFEGLLKRLSRLFESVMIIIDGLDECSKPDERSKILDLLSSLNSPEHGTIKAIYTSRDEIDIRRAFSGYESISIAARGNDLELYVAAVIEMRIKNKSLRMKDPALKEIIINGLVSKANGMFQWAKCQLDHLCLLSTDKERRRALEILPKDLFETYRRILERVNSSTESNQRLVEKTLRWLAFGDEIFSIQTICTAVAVEISSSFIDPDNIPDEDSILWWCSSLVSKDEKTGAISFSHFTVKEFLVDENILNYDNLRRYHMDPEKSACILIKVSLTYILSREFSQYTWSSKDEIDDLIDQNPLLKTSCSLWPTKSQFHEEDDELFQLICSLLDPIKTQNFNLWLEVYYPINLGHEEEFSASPLHIAATFGLLRVCRWLLQQEVDYNLLDKELGTPLMCAIGVLRLVNASAIRSWPRIELVELLLQHGAVGSTELIRHFPSSSAKIDDRIDVHTPMTIALDFALDSLRLCTNMFVLLLDFKAISRFSSSKFWKYTLRYDDQRIPGLLSMFKTILKHPSTEFIDLESKGRMLSFITRYEPDAEGRITEDLTNELDISAFNGDTELVLSVARHGKTKLLKTLLDKGFDQDTLSNCLRFAASMGYKDMLKMLLDHPLCKDPLFGPDIQAAWIGSIRGEQIECAKFFINYGIDVNATVPRPEDFRFDLPIDGSALAYAIMSGHLEVINFLLTVPSINYSITTSDGFSILHFTAQAPHHRIILMKRFIDLGLDPRSISNNGKSILHSLCENTYPLEKSDVEVVQLLIERGCDFRTVDSIGDTPLHCILRRPDVGKLECLEAMLKFLNPAGQLNSMKTKGEILPLQLAIRGRAYSPVLKYLIPAKTSLWNSLECRKSSALHDAVTARMQPPPPPPPSIIAIRPGLLPPPPPPPPPPGAGLVTDTQHMLRILRLLLEQEGVNINIVDEHGNTPLIAFCKGCHSPFYGPKILILGELIAKGADIDATNSSKWSAVHYLAALGFVDGLCEISEAEFRLDTLNENGYSPLHQAIFEGSINTVRFWLRQANSSSADSSKFCESLEQPSTTGLLPIHLAALLGRTDIVCLFHDMGKLKDINVPSHMDGITPLHLAAARNHTMTMETLIRLGADVNAIGKRKATPLHFAAETGSVAAAHLLLKHGADLELEDSLGRKPWMNAESNKHQQLKIALQIPVIRLQKPEDTLDSKLEPVISSIDTKRLEALDYTSDSDSDSNYVEDKLFSAALKAKRPPSDEHKTFLDALESGNVNVCRSFLESGADVNKPLNEEGETPLHIASYQGSSDVVLLLIQYGAGITARDSEDDAQPIHFAANNGCHRAVRVLMNHGALPTVRNKLMETPVHLAASKGYIDVLRELLWQGPSISLTLGEGGWAREEQKYLKQNSNPPSFLEMRDNGGQTAFLAALDSKHLATAEFLMRRGANIMATDLMGRDALWLAGFDIEAKQSFFRSLIDQGLKPRPHPLAYTSLCSLAARKFVNTDSYKEVVEIASYLIGAGATLDSNNSYSESPLHRACEAGNEMLAAEFLKLMPKHELDVESHVCGTPIYAAAFNGKLSVVKLLIEAGADIDLGCRGESPLAASIAEGHVEVAEYLQSHGAKIPEANQKEEVNQKEPKAQKLEADGIEEVKQEDNVVDALPSDSHTPRGSDHPKIKASNMKIHLPGDGIKTDGSQAYEVLVYSSKAKNNVVISSTALTYHLNRRP